MNIDKDKIIKIMNEKGITMADAARQMKQSEAWLSEALDGKHPLDQMDLLHLASALRVALSDLI